jgi:DNA-binding transcriptional ArsR family regulator
MNQSPSKVKPRRRRQSAGHDRRRSGVMHTDGSRGDSQAAKALAHPLRAQILTELTEEASPKTLARRLKQPLGSVSYHVGVLEQLGCIELTRTRPVRGALEHFYRARVRVRIELEEID